MKAVIINKSDATGGAAVVSRRLMEALLQKGVDARMLVCEKLTDSPYVELAAPQNTIKSRFLTERLRIFIANGFNRSTLFKIDTGETGLPLWHHPLVKAADAILVNWVNQGMLSLRGFKKILELGKPVIITMHDMWWLTGICHHAGECRHFLNCCGECPLLGKKASGHDLSYTTWKRKERIYSLSPLMKKAAFVPVSTWLETKARESSLLKYQNLEVIPNPFNISDKNHRIYRKKGKFRILFGAARLDDPIKGIDTLRATSEVIKNEFPNEAAKIELVLFGGLKNPDLIGGFSLPMVHLGTLKGEEAIKTIYKDSDVVVSASSYETLPGTLVEAQAYGCIPVAYRRGGQPDIITHQSTGFMAEYDDDIYVRAHNLAEGIIWALRVCENPDEYVSMAERMRRNVTEKFSYSSVADSYLHLIKELSGK